MRKVRFPSTGDEQTHTTDPTDPTRNPMTRKPSQPTGPETHRARCAGCHAALVDDQRYCLECGTRRGRPRLDFTAFWKAASTPHDHSDASDANAPLSPGASVASWFGPGAPSRRVTGVLAAAVLAGGIVAGGSLGPAPASSLAGGSTIVQRALAALTAQASGGSPASASASSTPPADKAKGNSLPTPARNAKAASSESSTSSSSTSESGASGTSSSKESSSEGPSSEGSGEGHRAAPGAPVKLPPIKHVWLIALSGESFDAALAQPKSDPYLAKQLVPKGTLLSDYTLTASNDLANEIALLSGQSVNLDTERDCPTYAEMQPPTVNTKTGLAEGIGCIYPQRVHTLVDELTAAGLTWKAYAQGMGSPSTAASTPPEPPAGGSPTPTQAAAPDASTPAQTPAAAVVTCRHPEAGAADPNGAPAPGDPYVTFHNPFVYFHSLLDNGSCASDDVDLGNLGRDLATPTTTPNLSWIAPSACDDGSAAPCAPGAAAGIGAADGLLKEVVPKILATAAYREGGLIAIVPDSPPSSPASAAGKPAGALLLSPFVRAGSKASESFNDFSLLKSLARLFGVLPLGHANDPGTVSLGATVYSTTEKAVQAASPPRSHRHRTRTAETTALK